MEGCYNITLLVTVEQEDAIIRLYRERHWTYIKTGQESEDRGFNGPTDKSNKVVSVLSFHGFSVKTGKMVSLLGKNASETPIYSDHRVDTAELCPGATVVEKASVLATSTPDINLENGTSDQMSTHGSYRLVKTEAATFCEDYESYFGEENNEEGTHDEVVIYSCAKGFEPERTKVDIEISDYKNGKEHSAIKEDNKETKYDVVKTTIKRVKQKDAEDARKRKRVRKEVNIQGKIVGNTVVENKLSSIKPELKDDFHDPVSSENCNNNAVTSAKSDFQDKVIIRKDKKGKQKRTNTKQESRKTKVSIQCEDCKTTFKHRANYENHIFDNKCKIECEYCGKVFLHGKFANYKMHLKYHRKDYNFQCQECGIKFMARSRLIKHQQKHNKPYKCNQCSVGFTSESALYTHTVTGHSNEDGKYPCPECHKEHATRQSLANHLSYNHPFGGVRYLPCSVCGMLCKERNLKKHEATHNTKSHKCDQCPSAFKTKESLTQHKKRHSKSYSELCKICGRGCYGPAELREHMRVHTGEKPYTCSLCDYRCALRGNLKLHMKVHDKSK